MAGCDTTLTLHPFPLIGRPTLTYGSRADRCSHITTRESRSTQFNIRHNCVKCHVKSLKAVTCEIPPTRGGGTSEPPGVSSDSLWFLKFGVWSESDSVQAIDPVTGDLGENWRLQPEVHRHVQRRTDTPWQAKRYSEQRTGRWGENEREEWQRGVGGAVMDEENGAGESVIFTWQKWIIMICNNDIIVWELNSRWLPWSQTRFFIKSAVKRDSIPPDLI